MKSKKTKEKYSPKQIDNLEQTKQFACWYCYRYKVPHDLIEDVIQEAILALYINFFTFDRKGIRRHINNFVNKELAFRKRKIEIIDNECPN
jgi:hypothetical protein